MRYGGEVGSPPRYGPKHARMKLLLARRAGYLPKLGDMGNPHVASKLWHALSKNLARDSREAGADNPMQYLRNRIQGGALEPMPEAGAHEDIADMLAARAGQGQGGITWGGRRFRNADKLFGWEQKHGNRDSYDEFFAKHPAAAELLGVGGPGMEEIGGQLGNVGGPGGVEEPFDPRAALLGQMRGLGGGRSMMRGRMGGIRPGTGPIGGQRGIMRGLRPMGGRQMGGRRRRRGPML